MEDLVEKVVFPCEKTTDEILLRDIWGTALGFEFSGRSLRRVTTKIQDDCVPWATVRSFFVLGMSNEKKNRSLAAVRLEPGVYVNRNGDNLILIHPDKTEIQSYIDRCGKQLRCLRIYDDCNTNFDLSCLSELEVCLISDNRELRNIIGLEQLCHLRELSLSGCVKISTLPNLNSLTNLIKLDLSYCFGLIELPPLDFQTKLTNLDLSECSMLLQLPSLDNQRELTVLNLSGCTSLSQLPPLDNLTQLTTLDVSSCGNLDHLPSLESLKCLTTLNLVDCSALTQVPSLDNLTGLTDLKLSWCNNLQELPALDNLTQLISLDISGCLNIRKLPPLDKLAKLSKLEMCRCTGLDELPKEIRTLKGLRTLDLRHLQLKELPDWLPDIAERFTLSNVVWDEGKEKAIVYFGDTTVETIPDMSIFEQPYEVVAEFFRNRALGRTHPLNEIKVVFLGDGEAGKSHTIARLMNDGGEPDHLIFDGQSTPGIVIRNKEYDLGDRKITVHFWDFGGQEIMHSMHRIFLTGRTMYVILLNARDDTQNDRAKYWLHNVKSFAPDAPVLLVLNKIDQNPNASVDERDLHGRYDKLTQVVKLSAKEFTQEQFNNSFTNALLEEIQNTGFLDAQWPTIWTKVKEKLENMESHYIMGPDYQAICRECHVDENQKNLLHWFNDLGISFCCDGEDDYTLEDYVILRPDWITNALYIIIFNTLEGAQNGLIPHRSIYNLLRNACNNPAVRCTLPQARYTSNDIGYVLGIMRKFNLSFTDGHENEFIPMLCQQDSMVDTQYYQKDEDTLEFLMEFDYLHSNLLHRLMVERYSELDMTTVWRTGARFRLDELGYSAVVVIDGNTLRFFVRHTDSMHRPNTYLTMLKAHVDRIVVKMGLKAPVCRLVYKLDGKRDEFDYEDVKLNRELGDTTMTSKAHRKKILIEDVLNQSAPDDLEDEKKLLNQIIQACGNIQDEPLYRLIPNPDGHGYVNGQGMEDLRNRRIRDNLINIGYRMNDQTQRGTSSTGKSIGELDMLVYNDSNTPWTIIEALRVSNKDKSEWNGHLKKLTENYNTRGFPALYLLTYVDADAADFAQICDSYRDHIKTHHPGQMKYTDGSFAELNISRNQYIKVIKCRYSDGGDPIAVYHIFAQIPIKNG